jgi:hypothetical protein
MNRLVSCAFAIAALLTAAVAANGSDGTYSIKLHRPVEVGDRMHVRGDGLLERAVTAIVHGEMQPAQETRLTVAFEADAEVLAVDEFGRATRIEYTVKECTVRQDGVSSVVAPAGSKILARLRAASTVFEIDGRRVDDSVNEALQLVARFDATTVTEDDLAGTEAPRAVGESWPIDVDENIRELRRQTGQRITRSDLSGLTTLVEVKEHAGEPCLALYTQISTENFVPGLRDIPFGFELTEGATSATAHRLFPMDESQPAITDFRSVDVEAVVSSGAGSAQPFSEMRFNISQLVEIQRTPIEDQVISSVIERD